MNNLRCASLTTSLIVLLGAVTSTRASSNGTPAPSVSPAPVVGPGEPGMTTRSGTMIPAPTSPPALSPQNPSTGGPGPMSPQNATMPKYLEKAVTPEEFQAFVNFQRSLYDDPTNKHLLAEMADLKRQVQRLQGELTQRNAKAMADHPEMRAIALKMEQAMFAHGPMPRFPNGPGSGAMPPHPPVMPTVVVPAPKQ